MKIYHLSLQRHLRKYSNSKIWKTVMACVVLIMLTAFTYSVVHYKPQTNRVSCFDKENEHFIQSNSSCGLLEKIPFLDETDDLEVRGKFMEDTVETREKATFLLKPRLHLSYKDCNNKIMFGDRKGWSISFFVKSSIGNRDRRDAIRSTWGAVKVLDGTRIEVIFVVGTKQMGQFQHNIKEESEVYGDILQLNMIDSPKTVPEKVLAGMQWASEFLPEHWLYASVDDDIAVHLGNLVSYFNTLMQPREPLASLQRPCYENLPLVCVYSYQDYDAPDRNIGSKWYISYDDAPDKMWPKYCRGGLYVMPVKMAAELYEASRRTAYLYLDDVWITGFMRRKLGYGDCNIMPGPQSQTSDWWWWHRSVDPRHSLMQHLWGNMAWRQTDVAASIKRVWETWKETMTSHTLCIPAR